MRLTTKKDEMKLGPADVDFLWRAIALAGRGEGHTRPNPPVGAVVVQNGRIVGEGWHRKAGGDHAEVAAIKNAVKKGHSTQGASIYVTLEPCSKPGRVGACTDAIKAAGIARVVYAAADPNPANRGKAKRMLAKAGIPCTRVARAACERAVWDDCGGLESLRQSARRLIEPFAKHVLTGLPFVTVKLAMSLDGKICDDFGDAKWISSAASRKIVGWERASVDAIMVGAETVRRDNPSLLSHNKRNDDLVRVVISRSGKLPKNAQIFTDGAVNETLVFSDAKQALVELGKRGLMHVYCEGGLTLARSLADEGLVDRWISVLSPIVIGSRPIKAARRFAPFSYGFSDPVAGDLESRYEAVQRSASRG